MLRLRLLVSPAFVSEKKKKTAVLLLLFVVVVMIMMIELGRAAVPQLI